MCGIAGIARFSPAREPPDRAALLRMAGTLDHRGPDEMGMYRDHAAALVSTRLSIVDVAGGHQPLCNEDETLWIAFNGEIFNSIELRAELEPRGHRFRTRGDTETIVHAYEEWGEDAFHRMNGQWAVALWDRRSEVLVLARDPAGICPLFIHADSHRVVFASEVKAIFAADAGIERRLDPRGIDQTLTFWSVVPPQSVFAGIEELEPGHLRVYRGGAAEDRCFAATEFPTGETGGLFTGSVAEAAEAVREALMRATKLRMLRADVPVGCYLSGGLDSSLVAVLGRRFAPGRFHTFSLRFEDEEYDESEYQRLMARELGSEHHEVLVRRADIAAAFPDVVYHAERPILRTAPAPLFRLSRLVRETGLKVVLTGEGADEMFAGYDLFREGKIRRFWAREPASARRPRLLERLYPYLARSPVAHRAMAGQFFGRNLAQWNRPGFAHDTRWHGTAALKRLYSPALRAGLAGYSATAELLDALPGAFHGWGSLQQDQYLEIRTLLAGYLLSSQGDRMLMAHSVEGRFPFLDPDVIALAHSLPAEHKLRVLDEKHVLKRVAAGAVPDRIIRRKKQPYRAPDAIAFSGPSAPAYLDDYLSDDAVAQAGIFDPAAVRLLRAKCARSGAAPFSNADNMAAIAVLSTQILHDRFIRRQPQPARLSPVRVDVDFTLEPVR